MCSSDLEKDAEELLSSFRESIKEKRQQISAREEADADKAIGSCEDTECELTLDFDELTSCGNAEDVMAESARDGLILSLCNLGRVDIEYISSVTGIGLKKVISELDGIIFQNPLTFDGCYYLGFETAEEYLSGNLLAKWKAAKEANLGFYRLTGHNDYIRDQAHTTEEGGRILAQYYWGKLKNLYPIK